MKPKVVFLLASISQPRCIKRIRSFIRNGFEVEVYGFDRGVYNINAVIEGQKIHNLGFAESGKGYIKKFKNAKNALNEIFKANKQENVIYYAFAFDIALLCKLFGKKKYVYEISDIVYEYFNNEVLRMVFAMVDRRLIKSSLLTVMTSKGFIKHLFPKLNQTNIIEQPNRVDVFFRDKKRGISGSDTNKLVFSYVGAFRHPNTNLRFAKVIGEYFPNHEFHFYGDSFLTGKVKELCELYNNVCYFGPYKNPEDLQGIYEKTDIVVACYDTKSINERISEPNKLYESLFFGKPIVVSEETFLAERVEQLGCGFAIDATSDYTIRDFVGSITTISLNEKLNNINHIPESEIIDDDGKKIIDFITSNFNDIR